MCDELVPARVSLVPVSGRGLAYRQREATGFVRATFFVVVARLLLLIPIRLTCAQATDFFFVGRDPGLQAAQVMFDA